MALTRDFKETVKARAERDPASREAVLTEADERLLAGDLETGKAVLHDYINATVGFEKLAKATGTPSKSLMRMFGPSGNPTAENLLAVIALFAAYIASRTVAPGTPYILVFRVVGTVAFLGYAGGAVPPSIWMGKPWRSVRTATRCPRSPRQDSGPPWR